MTSTAIRRRDAVAPRDLRITNWPLRDDGPKVLLPVVIVATVAVCVASFVNSPATGLLALAALMLAMWRLWIPVTYEFNSQGVTQVLFGRRRRVSWRKIGGYRVRRGGVWLLPHDSELQVAAPRSLFVRGGRQLETLVAVVTFYLGPPLP
ncbi:MAG: hypothetical protein RIC55_36365 [Pirellulaceae bacterium]